MAIAVAVLLVLGVVLLSAWPLLRPAFVRIEDEAAARRADLVAERDRVLAALKDVDLDFQMRKISEQDHAFMKAGLERQALAALSRLEVERRDAGAAEGPAGPESREPA